MQLISVFQVLFSTLLFGRLTLYTRAVEALFLAVTAALISSLCITSHIDHCYCSLTRNVENKKCQLRNSGATTNRKVKFISPAVHSSILLLLRLSSLQWYVSNRSSHSSPLELFDVYLLLQHCGLYNVLHPASSPRSVKHFLSGALKYIFPNGFGGCPFFCAGSPPLISIVHTFNIFSLSPLLLLLLCYYSRYSVVTLYIAVAVLVDVVMRQIPFVVFSSTQLRSTSLRCGRHARPPPSFFF